ncbi:hypothetical protein HK101_010703, partial [Irineochytrium annulatum]
MLTPASVTDANKPPVPAPIPASTTIPPTASITDPTEFEDRELPKFKSDLVHLRSLFSDNFSRLRQELDLILERSPALMRLGVSLSCDLAWFSSTGSASASGSAGKIKTEMLPAIEALSKLRADLRNAGEMLPERSLSVAIVGPQGSGKSAVLNRIIGKENLFGESHMNAKLIRSLKDVTVHNYAFVHATSSKFHSPLYSGPSPSDSPSTATPTPLPPRSRRFQEAFGDLVVVSHQIETLRHISFFDTIASDVPPAAGAGRSNGGGYSLSGLNVGDPCVESVALSLSPPVHAGTNAEADGASEEAGAAVEGRTPSRDLGALLQTESVDVVIFVVAQSQVANVPRWMISQTLDTATVPILVVNKLDNIWNQLYAKGGGDVAKKYSDWKRQAMPMVQDQIGIPGLTQFYVSAAQDNMQLNDMDDLQSLIEFLIPRRKTLKTITATARLANITGTYNKIVNNTTTQLKTTRDFLKTIIDLFDRPPSNSTLSSEFEGALIRSFYSALEDIGYDDPAAAATTYEAALEEKQYLTAARCLELGLHRPGVATSLPTRKDVVKLFKSASDDQANLVLASTAAHRLSHLHRPTTEGGPGDATKSIRQLTLAAGRGSVRAQLELGVAMVIGDSVDVDLPGAERWFTKAAEKGEPEAMRALAGLLAAKGTDEGKQAAVLWLRKALARKDWPGAADASLALSVLLGVGVGGGTDATGESARLATEAAKLCRERCVRVLEKVFRVFSTDNPLRNAYTLKAFLDRLLDQLRTQMVFVRNSLTSELRKLLPTVNSEDLPPAKIFQSLVLEETNLFLSSWLSGGLDEEADITADDEPPSSSHPLPSIIQTILTTALPGLEGTARTAENIATLYAYQSLPNPKPAASSFTPAQPCPLFIALFLGVMTGMPVPSNRLDGAVDSMRTSIATAWSCSVRRLMDGVGGSLTPVLKAVESELEIWLRRLDWSTAVVDECEVSLAAVRSDLVRSLLEARKAEAVTGKTDLKGKMSLKRPKRAPTKVEEKAEGATVTPAELGNMPFVWEGASIITSSQLLDEVTGSVPHNAWDWKPEGNDASVASMGQGTRIDELLNEGVTEYTNNASSRKAMGLWRDAQRLAEQTGDLIREASAISNLGCAERMQGKFGQSLSLLESAWVKSCKYVISAKNVQLQDEIGINLILTSLNGDPMGPISVERAAMSTGPPLYPITNWSHARGPVALIWFMRLLINVGHSNLTMGKVVDAGKWYDACIRLCENTLSRLPVPTPSQSTTGGTLKRSGSISKRGPALSYMHRATLLSYVRSLIHRGLCYSTLGSLDDSLKAQTLGLQVLQTHAGSLGEAELTYRAAIQTNLGKVKYSMGDLAGALGHHAKSAMLFLKAENASAHARELGNMGALWVEVGKTLRSLQWTHGADEGFARALAGDFGGPKAGGGTTRPVTKEDVEKTPNAVYRVGVKHRGKRGGEDLEIDLNVGDNVKVFMVMEDGVTALGERGGKDQGTFPLSCLEVDKSGEELKTSASPTTKKIDLKEIKTYGEVVEFLERSNQVGLETFIGGKMEALDPSVGHCGTPYVQLGLGMLTDVVQLGAETPEVVINIGMRNVPYRFEILIIFVLAVGEVMINQPYRAIASLLRLVSDQKKRIAPSLARHVSLTLASAFLMLVFANEEEEQQASSSNLDRFQDRFLVNPGQLYSLQRLLGVQDPVQDLERITRSDIYPLIKAAITTPPPTGSGILVGTPLWEADGTLDGMAASILGTLECMTGLWIKDMDSSSPDWMEWMDRGCRRITEAVEGQSIAMRDLEKEEGGRLIVDGARVVSGVFTVASSLFLLEERMLPKGSRRLAGSLASIRRSQSAGRARAGGIGLEDLMVWSWATNNSRLQVCARCAPAAFHLSVVGMRGGEGRAVFPCEHLRTSGESLEGLITSDEKVKTVSAVDPEGVFTEAADKVFGEVVRRATESRLQKVAGNEVAGSGAGAVDGAPRTAAAQSGVTRRSSIMKAPLWNPPRESSVAGGVRGKISEKLALELESEDNLVDMLKVALKGFEEKRVERGASKEELLGGQGRLLLRKAGKASSNWINMFYKDATAAVQRSNSERKRRSVMMGVHEEEEDEAVDDELPEMQQLKAVSNNFYDEAMELTDEDEDPHDHDEENDEIDQRINSRHTSDLP